MAIPTTAVWEVNTSGSASNGGGFDSALSGTDRSQSAAGYVEIEQSAVVGSIQATTTNFKFTLGYTVSSADIGNIVYFANSGAGGLGTVGHYVITNISGTDTWILDRSCGSSGGVPTGIMGGCKAAPANLIAASTPIVAGNTIWCKGSQTINASTVVSPAIANVRVAGYTTTRGDNARPTWTLSGASLTIVTHSSSSATGWLYESIQFDGASQSSARGFNVSAGALAIVNCGFTAFANNCIVNTASRIKALYCEFGNCTGIAVSGNSGYSVMEGCRWYGNSSTGVTVSTSGRLVLTRCLFHDGSGSSSDHIRLDALTADLTVDGCTIDNAGRHGINLQGNAAEVLIQNCLITNNGASGTGYGISTTATNPPTVVRNCAYYANATGETTGLDSGRVTGSISLTGDPYNDRSSDDYRLHPSAAGAAQCKGTGYPASLNSFSTSRNIGAFDTVAASASTHGYAYVM